MTNEEINNTIDCLKEVHDLYDVMCGDWSFCWTAIEALEKQKAKKPIPFINTGYDNPFQDFKCPVCGTEVYEGCCCQNNECRQKLDWSEGND